MFPFSYTNSRHKFFAGEYTLNFLYYNIFSVRRHIPRVKYSSLELLR